MRAEGALIRLGFSCVESETCQVLIHTFIRIGEWIIDFATLTNDTEKVQEKRLWVAKILIKLLQERLGYGHIEIFVEFHIQDSRLSFLSQRVREVIVRKQGDIYTVSVHLSQNLIVIFTFLSFGQRSTRKSSTWDEGDPHIVSLR